MCQLSQNLGASTSWNPLGLSRPVMGLLYLYNSYSIGKYYFHVAVVNEICNNIHNAHKSRILPSTAYSELLLTLQTMYLRQVPKLHFSSYDADNSHCVCTTCRSNLWICLSSATCSICLPCLGAKLQMTETPLHQYVHSTLLQYNTMGFYCTKMHCNLARNK